MIVADTGAIVALIDADDRQHGAVRALFEQEPRSWTLPWAILPEVDYLLSFHVGAKAAAAFLADLASGAFVVEWGTEADLIRAHELSRRHRALAIGFVDAVVLATAERLRADAIATLDLRHFAAVRLATSPRLLPRDA